MLRLTLRNPVIFRNLSLELLSLALFGLLNRTAIQAFEITLPMFTLCSHLSLCKFHAD